MFPLTPPRCSRLACYALLLLALLGAACIGKPATLKILLPEDDATVEIDGIAHVGFGKERLMAAPAGKSTVVVQATWWTNNYTKFIRTQVVKAWGDKVVVDLRKPDPNQEDRIEIRFVPTPMEVVEVMCEMAKVTKDDVIFDLGCGDGVMVITAIGSYKAKRGVGIDLDPQRILEAKANAVEFGVEKRIDFRVGDVLDVKDLSEADVVMLYMGEDVNMRLRPVLWKTLKVGARVVSHAFGMRDWEPDDYRIALDDDGVPYELYSWTIKEEHKKK